MRRQVINLLFLAFFFFTKLATNAQIDVIEIDTVTRAAVRTAPFDKPFLIKAQIEADEVKTVFLIPKAGDKTLDSSISYYAKKSKGGSYYPPEIEENYFWTRKIGEKNYLFVSIADKYLFKPSRAYFVIPIFRQTDPVVVSFFDLYYQSTQLGPTANTILQRAEESLKAFESKMRKIYGRRLEFGYMTLNDFKTRRTGFDSSFTKNLLPFYLDYQQSKSRFNAVLPECAKGLVIQIPSFDSLTYHQLKLDTTVNKAAVDYLSGNAYVKNDLASDFMTLNQTNETQKILSGALGLHCIYCEMVDLNSNTVKDLTKRNLNLDSSIKQLLYLQRALYLLNPQTFLRKGSNSNIQSSISRINIWVKQLQSSKDSIAQMIRQRKKIESAILDGIYVGKTFNYSQVLAGNSYLNFETRNKLLLTPDFGVVTSAITKSGKDLDYGIIPYLGFHINLMAVDKDIPFGSYKKSSLQYFSIAVGWSLVSMNKDSSYANFFEKSSFLTGVGYRLNNVIRLTGGWQWFFKIGMNDNKIPTRNLKAIPYLGLSFDLNVKQYLNGFVDLLSGIGKTKPASAIVTNSQQ